MRRRQSRSRSPGKGSSVGNRCVPRRADEQGARKGDQHRHHGESLHSYRLRRIMQSWNIPHKEEILQPLAMAKDLPRCYWNHDLFIKRLVVFVNAGFSREQVIDMVMEHPGRELRFQGLEFIWDNLAMKGRPSDHPSRQASSINHDRHTVGQRIEEDHMSDMPSIESSNTRKADLESYSRPLECKSDIPFRSSRMDSTDAKIADGSQSRDLLYSELSPLVSQPDPIDKRISLIDLISTPIWTNVWTRTRQW